MSIKRIEQLRHDIFNKYRLERYRQITGDSHFRNVPKELMALWYGEEINALSFRTMDYYYQKCSHGEIPENELFEELTRLKDAFAHEFELLNKANKKKGGA